MVKNRVQAVTKVLGARSQVSGFRFRASGCCAISAGAVVALALLAAPIFASAQTVSPNLPGSVPAVSPLGFIANFYQFALLIGGLLAFGAIVYGGIKYTLSAANPSLQGDARDQITQALLGLLLLLGAVLILNTINPGLTKLELPKLEALPASSGTGGGGRTTTCQERQQCFDSPAVRNIVSCVSLTGPTVAATTWQGSHSENSCHFGGRLCTDGSRAIDYGFNALGRNTLPPDQFASRLSRLEGAIRNCASSYRAQVECHYEDPVGNRTGGLLGASHLHCNVNAGACGCN